jgi:hypothetical protein
MTAMALNSDYLNNLEIFEQPHRTNFQRFRKVVWHKASHWYLLRTPQ